MQKEQGSIRVFRELPACDIDSQESRGVAGVQMVPNGRCASAPGKPI